MEKIVVATDFSEAALNAVHYGASLAKYFNANLLLVHAFSVPLGGYDSIQPLEMLNNLRSSANERLMELKKEVIQKMGYDPGIECVTEIGFIVDILKNLTLQTPADCIVMGMVGEAGLVKKHLIGSNVTEVAQQINFPLFIVPEKAKYKAVEKISFACDVEHIEDTTLLALKYFCSVFNASLEIIQVISKGVSVPEGFKKEQQHISNRLGTIQHTFMTIKDENVAAALNISSQVNRPDLLIVHAQKHSLWQRLFSKSVTKSLAFESEIPVLVIH